MLVCCMKTKTEVQLHNMDQNNLFQHKLLVEFKNLLDQMQDPNPNQFTLGVTSNR